MTPEKDIIRYLKVKALATQGIPGERDNAQLVVKAMEAKYPSIKMDATAYTRVRSEATKTSTSRASAPSGVWPKEPTTPSSQPASGNWENIFRYAKAAAEGAYGFAQAAANVVLGKQLATEVKLTAKANRSGSAVLVSYSIPMHIYEAAFNLNLLQRQAFREALHEMLDQKLDELFDDEVKD